MQWISSLFTVHYSVDNLSLSHQALAKYVSDPNTIENSEYDKIEHFGFCSFSNFPMQSIPIMNEMAHTNKNPQQYLLIAIGIIDLIDCLKLVQQTHIIVFYVNHLSMCVCVCMGVVLTLMLMSWKVSMKRDTSTKNGIKMKFHRIRNGECRLLLSTHMLIVSDNYNLKSSTIVFL